MAVEHTNNRINRTENRFFCYKAKKNLLHKKYVNTKPSLYLEISENKSLNNQYIMKML